MKKIDVFVLILVVLSGLNAISTGKPSFSSATRAEILDTLTVIQRPLLNIPAIVIPGENLTIECVAPTGTTNWAVQLRKDEHSVIMTIINSTYVSSPGKWVITAIVPNVPVYELYDLYVTASGGISDRTRHSVKVLPTRKSNYYFAQVTDVHLPSPIFSPNSGYDTDSTSMVDFREVIRDMNIIRPEFLIITGDYINEGELEDYQDLHYVAKGKRIMAELEIPVYLTSGNHDIGGWDSTPPPDGNSRYNWWKYFGWSWLSNSSTSWPYHTQDYSFDYGTAHFTCMEAYINYDNYLSSVYGSQSYTSSQLAWLQNDVTSSNAVNKILFHHYDFSSQLNLSALGIQMALKGHAHTNSGSLTTTPYNLGLQNCSQGKRAYRIVKINNGVLQPFAPCVAGTDGSKISISYSPSNIGIADSVMATLVNNQTISFENSLARFVMPAGETEYSVLNGTIEQVDRGAFYNTVYVGVDLAASSTKNVSLWVNGVGKPEQMAIAVNRINGNAVISWQSGWGTPAGYQVYRSTAYDFTPSPLSLIATCPASQTSFTDVGVGILNDLYYYRVIAYK